MSPPRPPRDRLPWLLALGLLLGIEERRGAADRGCPPGQVLLSPGHCAFKDQCPDGTLPRAGKCVVKDFVAPEPQVRLQGLCQTSFSPAAESVKASGCGGRRATGRHVFLANGPVVEVLGKYLREAEQQGIKVDLQRLTVHYFDEDNSQRNVTAPKMGVAHFFSGKTVKDLWRKTLGKQRAQARQDAPADAKKLSADVVCGD